MEANMALVNVYTDESRLNGDRFMLIGGLWIGAGSDAGLRSRVAAWRTASNMLRELKWTKISQGKLAEYKSFADIFFAERNLSLHCIAIDTDLVDYEVHCDGDSELGFYKFYFQLLSHRCLRGNGYTVFVDHRNNRNPNRLVDLQRCVNAWCAKKKNCQPIVDLQPRDSKSEDMLQLADVLLGAVGYCCNARNESPAKCGFVKHLANKIGRKLSAPTPPWERKINVWHWKPAEKKAQ
jgi:hypothetical protein